MTDYELNMKFLKEAIFAIREYCWDTCECDNCDPVIREWCHNSLSKGPSEWKLGDE